MKNPAIIVTTKNGHTGIIKKGEKSINGKYIVHTVINGKNTKLLCEASTLTTKGFQD